MIIGALKLTHDGTIALAKDNELIFSVEMEKINNNKRYSNIQNLEIIDEILSRFGYGFDDVDSWVIDGWQNDPETDLPPHIIKVGNENFEVNNYQNRLLGLPENQARIFFGGKIKNYSSYSHIYSHLCAAYCTSPFAKNKDDSYIVVYDGGTKPLLYFFDNDKKEFVFCNELLKLGGDIYPGVASLTPPFAYSRRVINGKETFTHRFAGKVMAYIAKGIISDEIIEICKDIYSKLDDDNSIENGWKQNRIFEKNLMDRCSTKYSSEDILASFHVFLQNMLVESLIASVLEHKSPCKNLCLSGGSMLNIKWNSAIRNTGCFNSVFAAPFINDTGAAIGAICAENISKNNIFHLTWNMYQGMPLIDNSLNDGWIKEKCTVRELAKLIYTKKEPIVVLNGRSELGPRALGNRSIIADARSPQMKDKLNDVKQREEYRPVAPICIEEDAPIYFVPGTIDKYMLFEHNMTDFGRKSVPAVMHIDGTARLQTISRSDNPVIYELLSEYKKISGISVLCNTSANNSGMGFFPDVASAQSWGKCKYIWSEGVLYTKW